jgi:hypothetical protein
MQVKHCVGMFFLLSLATICVCPSAKADTINVFSISGTGYVNCANYQSFAFQTCGPAEGFAGALEVDETTGMPIYMEMLIPGVYQFDTTFEGSPYFPPVLQNNCLDQGSPVAEVLFLCMTTPTGGSLAGFDGSAITGSSMSGSGVFDTNGYQYFSFLGGNITPVIASAPEPSSLLLVLVGLVGLGFVAQRKRKESRLIVAN